MTPETYEEKISRMIKQGSYKCSVRDMQQAIGKPDSTTVSDMLEEITTIASSEEKDIDKATLIIKRSIQIVNTLGYDLCSILANSENNLGD